MSDHTSTGSIEFNNFLKGGYEKDIVTTIFGPSGSGKTNFCLLAAVKVAESGKKVLLIDTEGGIAVERIRQLSNNSDQVLENMVFFQPLNFVQQQEVFDKVREIVNNVSEIGMIVVDSISMLYRLELGVSESIFETNGSLARQIALLVEIARSKKIPVIITNQVYADFAKKDNVKMVGGDLLKYGSKCLLELIREDDVRQVFLRKHRYVGCGEGFKFNIINSGIEKVE